MKAGEVEEEVGEAREVGEEEMKVVEVEQQKVW